MSLLNGRDAGHTFLAAQFFSLVVQQEAKAFLRIEELAHTASNLSTGGRTSIYQHALALSQSALKSKLTIAHAHLLIHLGGAFVVEISGRIGA